MSALPVDRIQMALAAAHRHLDVNPGTLVAKKFAECKDAENLRHYLEKIQMAYQNQVKKREEYQHQRRIEVSYMLIAPYCSRELELCREIWLWMSHFNCLAVLGVAMGMYHIGWQLGHCGYYVSLWCSLRL